MFVNEYTPTFYGQRVLKLPMNVLGKDYVVGDIHGCFEDLGILLAAVKFDTKKDRLITVGDLIDRGPEPHLVIDFLSRDWFFSVRGNHEQTLLHSYLGNLSELESIMFISSAVRQNGLGWWLKVPSTERRPIVDALAKLPLVIEVAAPDGSYGIVHADIPRKMTWATFLKRVDYGCPYATQVALEGRERLTKGLHEEVRGIKRVYVGHTIVKRLSPCANVLGIETGSFLRHMGIDKGCMTLLTLDGKVAAVRKPTKARPPESQKATLD